MYRGVLLWPHIGSYEHWPLTSLHVIIGQCVPGWPLHKTRSLRSWYQTCCHHPHLHWISGSHPCPPQLQRMWSCQDLVTHTSSLRWPRYCPGVLYLLSTATCHRSWCRVLWPPWWGRTCPDHWQDPAQPRHCHPAILHGCLPSSCISIRFNHLIICHKYLLPARNINANFVAKLSPDQPT